MKKLSFALNIEDGWPPVASESVWCELIEGGYKLVNAPFFISGIAYGDIFKADLDEVNGHVFEFEILEESGNSLVWVMNKERVDITTSLKELDSIGCRVEGFSEFNLYSIDIPSSVSLARLDSIFDKIESQGLAVAYPVWRLED